MVGNLCDVSPMVARGYPSRSFLYAAAEEISELERSTFICHFGDPAGVGKSAGYRAGHKNTPDTLPPGRGRAAPENDAFEERAAIAEHDGELPRKEAETLAARDQGFHCADDLPFEAVAHWRREIDRLANLGVGSRVGAEALRRAQAFIRKGWALQAVRLGWGEVELFGVCPRAPWQRRERKGAALGGAAQAVTQEAVVYVGGTGAVGCCEQGSWGGADLGAC